MNSQITILIIQALLKYGPGIAREVHGLFTKDEPTLEDFERVFAIADKSYEQYVAPPAVTEVLKS